MEEVRRTRRGPEYELNPEVAERRNELFNRYIMPHLNLVYWLCIKYSDDPENVEENYTCSLTNIFRGIETYNPEMPIATWIHIVTKRYVLNLNKGRHGDASRRDRTDDIGCFCDTYTAATREEPSYRCMDETNYREFYSDGILEALDKMNPVYRDALILQQAGYSMTEIAAIEYEKGTLKSQNVDTVKSRLFQARKQIREHLQLHGNK